ncbi:MULTISPECIES: Na+/H+ antiporter subunit E [Paenibacillus]|uniref:Na+/H+ antiporter subunit E n=1 Tax=Paenibacillus TaxID=44249 RepID=UPI00036E35C6|nr:MULTISPECIES: Na+/H+ antiporter subunit E [Paenibacillus]
MAFQIVLNLLIAVVWMSLHTTWDALNFIIGYMIGLLLIFAMKRFFPDDFYGHKVWAVWKLLLLFFWELIKSSVVVLRHIVSPRLNINPGILTHRTDLTSDWELTLLSTLVTLTPGTILIEVSREQQLVYIHAIDIQDEDKMSEDIRNTFEKAIKEVTR